VRRLETTLEAIRTGALEGEGFYPVRYEVGERLALLFEPSPFMRWTPTHPEFGEAESDGRR